MPDADTHTDETAPEDDGKNIWQELLQKSSSQGGWEAAEEVLSTMIVLGDRQNGKSAVLNKFRERVTNVGTPEYILDYSYINVKNKYNLDKDEVVSRMSVWQLDDHNHKDLLVNLVSPKSLSTACYVITADLAQPHNVIQSLTKWLDIAKEINDKLTAKLTEEETTALKTSVSRYNQFFVDPGSRQEPAAAEEVAPAEEAAPAEGGAEEVKEGEGDAAAPAGEATVATSITEDDSKEVAVDLTKPDINLGVPIVIVCNKADYFNRVLAKQGADEKFELIAHHLRQLAIKYGATLLYTSAFGEGINIDICQDYIFHRLFQFPLTHKAQVVGSAEDVGLYVPAGYDSADLISSGTQLKNGWTAATKLEDVFEDPAGKKSDKASISVATAASNEDFFNSLKEQLEKGHSGATPSASTSAPVEGQGEEKRNQKAVKSFFKSLLSGPAGGAKRDEAKAAMNEIAKE